MKFKNLIFRFPLLWNTRAPQMWLFLIFMNFLYFIMGYLSVKGRSSVFMNDDYFGAIIIDEFGVYMFATLVLFITLIIWLFQYLRNNAFKSFYPVSKSYLVKETLIVLSIFATLSFVYLSYQIGKDLKKKHLVETLDESGIEDIVNMAACFIPENIEKFEKASCCDSIYRPIDTTIKIDTRQKCVEEYSSEFPYPAPDTTVAVQIPNVRTMEYSYLNYCNKIPANKLFKGNYSDIAKRWLLNKQTDSIIYVLDAYNLIGGQVQIPTSLRSNKIAQLCFSDSNYTVDYKIAVNFSEMCGTTNLYTMNDVPSTIRRIKENSLMSSGQFIVWLYITLGLSFILLSFRFTRFKPWISSIIGTGVVTIVFVIIGNISKSDFFMSAFYVTFILTCGILGFVLIKRKQQKLQSAIWLIWFSIGLAGCLPVIFQQIYSLTGDITECINNYWVITRPALPIHHWISSNWNTINCLNIVLLVVTFFFFTLPNMYKWQANPSE